MLTSYDRLLVEQFERRLTIVRDRTRGVEAGWHTGFYLWGEGGISKSWTVLDELDNLGANYRLTNSRLTAKGLFELIEEYPDLVHVLEDMEELLRSPNASGVLRSALWTSNPDASQQHQERLITWRVGGYKHEVIFTGSIIITANLPLDDIPVLRAIKTRITHLHLQPTNAEIRAKMREISTHGLRHGRGKLTPEECMEVCEYVILKCDEAGKNYDLRMLIGGFLDRLQSDFGDSTHDWKVLVESRLKERVIRPVSCAERLREESAVAHEINTKPTTTDEKVALWRERTKKSPASFYRRLKG